MARRQKLIKLNEVSSDNRDRGKVFVLTEMDAEVAEDWGLRALLALSAAGAEVPDDFESAGMAGLAAMGVDALRGLKYDVVQPLWKQMFDCVQIIRIPEKGLDPDFGMPLMKGDIEEISTRLMLRKEIVELHINFSRLADLSGSIRPSEMKNRLGSGDPTPTGPEPWELS